MLKNQNIFVSLQIEKNLKTNALVLNIHFDTSAPNFFIENNVMHWNPTSDEIDFVTEVVDLLNHHEYHRPSNTDSTPYIPSEEKATPPVTIPPSDPAVDEAIDPDVIPHLAKVEPEEKIFIQADEKKIDEIIKRKKAGFSEEFVIESDDKTKIDRMLKQKKKKV
jgi:hypothetical protein